MANTVMYIGAVLPILWGISHLIPTTNVVTGFGDITEDNRHIIAMEWVVEGISLIFIGTLITLVTYMEPNGTLSFYIYCLSVAVLLVLAMVSFFTGYKVKFLPFKMCPFVLSLSAVLIMLGLAMQR